jgi:hypothetical protein
MASVLASGSIPAQRRGPRSVDMLGSDVLDFRLRDTSQARSSATVVETVGVIMARRVRAEERDQADISGEGEWRAGVVPHGGGASTPEKTHVPTLEARSGIAQSRSGSTEPETLEARNVHTDCTYRDSQLSRRVHVAPCHDTKVAARRPGDGGVAVYWTPSALGVGGRRQRAQPFRYALDGVPVTLSIVDALPSAHSVRSSSGLGEATRFNLRPVASSSMSRDILMGLRLQHSQWGPHPTRSRNSAFEPCLGHPISGEVQRAQYHNTGSITPPRTTAS